MNVLRHLTLRKEARYWARWSVPQVHTEVRFRKVVAITNVMLSAPKN
jgi:hypothetical protein